jgi:endonuclease/exonuclease/phosphatase family metal-dependent hydrolase
MRWHIGIFGGRKVLFPVLAIPALVCGLMIFNEVQGGVGRQRSEITPVEHPGREPGSTGQGMEYRLAVMTYNVGTLHGTKLAFGEIVNAVKDGGKPDLLLLQEIPNEEMVEEIARSLGLRYHVYAGYRAHGKGYGLAIVSSRPLVNPEMHYLKPYGHAALIAQMKQDEECVLVCSVHLERVRCLKKGKDGFQMSWKEALSLLRDEMTAETPRSGAVEELVALLNAHRSERVIVGGDFNTVPFSTAIRKMGKCYEDALWLRTDYLTASYKKVSFPIKPRIDYIFYSGGMRCCSASVIKKGCGDHYPVRAVLDIG